MLFGTNRESLHSLTMMTAGVTAVSYTYPARAGIPEQWPQLPIPGLIQLVSVRPDLDKVLSGELDEQIRRFTEQAPVMSMFALWDMANIPHLHLDQQRYIKAVLRAQTLTSPYYHYGQVLNAEPASVPGGDLSSWVVPGLDFYALRGTQRRKGQQPYGVFGQAVAQLRAVPCGGPILISGANCIGDSAAGWLPHLYYWAHAEGLRGLMLHIDPAAGAPGVPAMTAQRLARLAAASYLM